MFFLLTIQEPNKEPNKEPNMTGYENLTCEQLRERINEFKEYKRNWYFNIQGVSKLKKADLIDICKKCDDADAGVLKKCAFNNKEIFEMILNNNVKKAKMIGLDYTDDDFTYIEYRYNPFNHNRPNESSVIFVIPFEKNGKQHAFSSQKLYNTSSSFAMWLSNFIGDSFNDTDDEINDE